LALRNKYHQDAKTRRNIKECLSSAHLSGVDVLNTSVRVGLRAASLQLIVLVALIGFHPQSHVFARQLILGLASGRGYAAMPLILALWAVGIG
jgi:hypothetical protein